MSGRQRHAEETLGSRHENNLRLLVQTIRASGAGVVLIGVPEPKLFGGAPDFYERVAEDMRLPLEDDVFNEVLKDTVSSRTPSTPTPPAIASSPNGWPNSSGKPARFENPARPCPPDRRANRTRRPSGDLAGAGRHPDFGGQRTGTLCAGRKLQRLAGNQWYLFGGCSCWRRATR